MKDKEWVIYGAFGLVPVVWLALLVAPCMKDGLVSAMELIPEALASPFAIKLSDESLKWAAIAIAAYLMGIGIYFSTRRNYRRGEEMGSAKWGDAAKLNKRYAAKAPGESKLLTQNVRIGLDGRAHRRNLNVLVCGGSGSGKTRFYVKPNLMQANTSFVCLDPKGENCRAVGGLLKAKGYEVRVLDLINMERSHCYNPFVYLKDDNDIQRLATNLFKSTTPKGSTSSDPFWGATRFRVKSTDIA